MYEISLKNNKNFQCAESETLLDAARKSGIILEHSCLLGRCSSCKVKVEAGISVPNLPELSLTPEEIEEGFILSCVRSPKSDMNIQAEDLSEYEISPSRTFPTKINKLEKLTEDVIKVELRLPPSQILRFIPGQYINVIRGNIKRSYSIGNTFRQGSIIELFVKNYTGGILSNYWFNQAKVNDLLRIEGPKGTFFARKNVAKKNIIFLATGTGIAPVKAILETIKYNHDEYKNKSIYLFWGVRFLRDLFWSPDDLELDIKYFPVLSREKSSTILNGYVQNRLLDQNIDLNESIVYACGSNEMIKEAKYKLIEKGLSEFNFYSDAFVISN